MAGTVFYCEPDTEVTAELVQELIDKHKALINDYEVYMNMYKTLYDIFEQEQKESYKPDNRLAAAFAKYIVTTLNGYVFGKPVKVTHENKQIQETVNDILKFNAQPDGDYEVSKLASIYGHAFELVYQDEEARTCITHCPPTECFIVYEQTLAERPLFAVRTYKDSEGEQRGEVYCREQTFNIVPGSDGVRLEEAAIASSYGDVPVIEWVENEERQSVLEPVKSLMNEFNKSLSEKANDVDYFADAYLAVLGAELEEKDIDKLRDKRLINIAGMNDISKLVVEFLDKPNADATQENLLNRTERLIYQLSMVSNINSEDFGNASGVALQFKLQSMENLALIKERKSTKAMAKRFKLIFGVPLNIPPAYRDEWMNLEYTFERNIPRDTSTEANTFSTLEGTSLSTETKLKAIPSLVPDPTAEMERIKKEREDEVNDGSDFPQVDFSAGGVDNGNSQDQSELLDGATNTANQSAGEVR